MTEQRPRMQTHPGVSLSRQGDAVVDQFKTGIRSRITPYTYDRALYRQRHKIESLLAKFKDWRRVTTLYDRCAHTFFFAICIAATVIFWM